MARSRITALLPETPDEGLSKLPLNFNCADRFLCFRSKEAHYFAPEMLLIGKFNRQLALSRVSQFFTKAILEMKL
jgi:hypothetical protein